jgi:microcystin-dependent protein
MVDWDDPQPNSNYLDVLDHIKDRDLSVAKMDFTGDTDVPSDVIRANTLDNDYLERFNGSGWDRLTFIQTLIDHIADGDIHAVTAAGSIIMFAGSTAPTGWFLAQGAAVSRTTYADLFAITGTAYGIGDGATTFNLPDFRQRFPLGKADAGTGATLGETGGEIDHDHTIPGHDHSVPAHAHGLASHTHTVFGHSHDVPNHVHSVPAHYHNTVGNGATATTVAAGTHRHDIWTQLNAGGGTNRRSPNDPGTGGASPDRETDDAGSHSHAITGLVGNVNSGNNGDGSFNTLSSGAVTTNNNTDAASGGPSVANTDNSAVLTTGTGGAGATGTQNPPYLAVNFIIKY